MNNFTDKALDRALSYLEKKYGKEYLQYCSVLELGCGKGDLMPRFSMLFSSVTGLETDADACDEAMEMILDKDLENATALCMDLDGYVREFPHQTFDVVLCSNVFQHMTHEAVCGILEKLKEVMTPDSVCVFMTSYTDKTHNVYMTDYVQDDERIVLETDGKGFEEAARDPEKKAVCLFARPWMERFLLSCGLGTVDFMDYEGEEAVYLCEPLEGTMLRPSCGPSTASGKVSYMYFFYQRPAAEMNVTKLRKMQSAESIDTEPLRETFSCAENFLYGGDPRFPAVRCFRSTEIRSEKAAISDSHLIVSFYPAAGVAQVTVNFTLDNAPCDDFVYLRQVRDSRAPLFFIDGEAGSLPVLCENVLKECGMAAFSQGTSSIVTELNRFGPCRDPLALSLNDQRCLYGMLTGDEGYLHVPAALVEERMAECWTGRDFVRVIGLGGDYVFLNLNQSETFADYIDYQKPYADHYFGELNDYFTMDAPTAGVNHGLFFTVETGQLIRTCEMRLKSLSFHPAESQGFFVSDDIKRGKQIRNEILRFLNRVDLMELTEYGTLEGFVVRNLDTQQSIESIRSLLEIVQSGLDILYSSTTNRMVTILTILGLLFALIQTINSF